MIQKLLYFQTSDLQAQPLKLPALAPIGSLTAEAMTALKPLFAKGVAGFKLVCRALFKALKVGFSGKSNAEMSHLEPPAWKRILAVVLGLYPVILLQDYVFDYLEILEDWPPASALLVKLLLSSCIFTFVVMPIINKRLDFWLQPANQSPSLKSEVLGIGSTLTIMGMLSILFNALA
ncbi:MAG: hypothetical protein DCF25_19440 [Leptolyngbya foveolarum]|uniref:Uncharacterized protein n=1 Tax=Leptolyngbya foveolarum TaxID=47253 RepID=A0A2W4VP72_9CYAN|nr:MAG: hypothetical protein DCF25_19440 [Leptolyngbya foveolarum]